MLGNGPSLDEKKYGKWFLYLSSPRAFSWGVALPQTRGAFCEHWDETLVVAVFKHHHTTAVVIYNFRNRFLVLK